LEWKNPDNWHGGILGIYYSKKDSRSWVPKKIPWMGWTINFAQSSGIWSLAILVMIPVIIILSIFLVMYL
jgi:uncharacterized membrane protein